MKVTAQPFAAQTAGEEKGYFGIYSELFKARLTLLVLLTTLVGFYVGSAGGAVDYLLMFHTVFGTALLASGASALNQLLERRYDSLMERTADRPLPSGRLEPQTALKVGVVMAALGLTYLTLAVNTAAAAIGACSLLSYLFIYTPLKRVTWWNTLVGAVPGGLPPLIGWTAAQGTLTPAGWTLFGILALWQLPHFMAIAWMYREDYARAGFKMLPCVDPQGLRIGRHAVVETVALLAVSCLPFVMRQAGPFYLGGAVVLGAVFLWAAIRFARQLTMVRARLLFYVSILYLPVLLGLMVIDRLR